MPHFDSLDHVDTSADTTKSADHAFDMSDMHVIDLVDSHQNGLDLTMLRDKQLTKELKYLKEQFTVDQAKLKQIVNRFRTQLKKGLATEGDEIPMNVTWVMGFPHGSEKGSFITLDLGGTNLRVCYSTLTKEAGGAEVQQHRYELASDSSFKNGDADMLWAFMVDCLEKFLDEFQIHVGRNGEPIPLAFTFSYPATQHSIDHGILQRWTKGFNIRGVEGEDVAAQLRSHIEARKLPIQLVSLVNDTTAAMIASAYTDPQTIVGVICGTGCNAAYMETAGTVLKIAHLDLPADTPMAINCEYGAFDNSLHVLPVTKYDTQIDAESARPGQQRFEKLSAGGYLGELFRLVVLDFASQGLMLDGCDLHNLRQSNCIDTAFLSAVENDDSEHRTKTHKLMQSKFSIDVPANELNTLQHIAQLIAIRGARLCACGVAAICLNKGFKTGHVAADGSVALKHPHFKKRWAKALGEIMDWEHEGGGAQDPIIMTGAEDGSGIGAAVIAAMTLERIKEGKRVGALE